MTMFMRLTPHALFTTAVLSCATVGATADVASAERTFDPGTEADREALFEFLLESTMEWDAFASLQSHPVYGAHPTGIDIIAEMEQYRDELIAADTDEKMWFVLNKISNVRRDPHLRVRPVEGGLTLSDTLRQRRWAPVRLAVDYADPGERFFFISDLHEQIDDHADGPVPLLGDRLIAVNDRTVDEYAQAIRPYVRHATENDLWRRLAGEITTIRNYIPHEKFYCTSYEALHLELERKDGSRYVVTLPYLRGAEIIWQGHNDPAYPGFSKIDELDEHDTFTLHLPDDPDLPVILLQWHNFLGGSDVLDATDALMQYSKEHDLLDHHVIVDATRARGGSNGAYVLARLQSQPFRTTSCNLKVSELMERWVNRRLERWDDNPPSPSRGQCDTHIHEWLKSDVTMAIEHDRLYTNDVPFKGVQPQWADGIIEPAETHFRGSLTVWLSPHGSSHVDQFAAQIIDNSIGHAMGMPTAGVSNSWWTRDVLRFPTTYRPIVIYEWSLGHSIRPNGEILQYNPAQPHEYIPQTRGNFFEYHAELLDRTLKRLDIQSQASDSGASP